MTSPNPSRPAPAQGARKLSQNQLQIWTGQQMYAASPLYNMAFAFVLEGRIQTDAFRDAWLKVLEQNAVLRSALDASEPGSAGEPHWHELAASECATEVLDISAEADPLKHFRTFCSDRARLTLPWQRGPLIDSVLVDLGAAGFGWYLNQHHLICDAFSTVLLYRLVAEHYDALVQQRSEPEALPQYGAVLEAAAGSDRATREYDAALEHWAQRNPRALDLYGGASPRASEDPQETAATQSLRRTVELTKDQTSRLDELAQSSGFRSLSPELSRFALFATLLSSWLHRVTEESTIGFETPVTGRSSSEAKRALGLFIEMFSFQVEIEPGETFRTLGAKCLAETQLLLRHALPGISHETGGKPSSATEATGAAGDAAGPWKSDRRVVLNYVPQSFGEFAGLPSSVRWVHPGHADAAHSLRLQVHDFGASGRTTLHFDGSQTALPEPFDRRAAEHFETLVSAVLENPDQQIGAIDLVTADEQRNLDLFNGATEFNGVAEAVPTPTVVESFLRQASDTPESIALRSSGQELSFEQVEQASRGIAQALVAQNLPPDLPVAILAPRSVSTVLGILGVLRAGHAYVPIAPSQPAARQKQILSDSSATLLLSEDAADPRASAICDGLDRAVTTVAISDLQTAADDSRAQLEPTAPDQLAYILYTSGSTGRPKGVRVTHRGLGDYLNWAARTYVRGKQMTFPLFTSLAFDLTLTSLFLPLMTGGTLDIYPESDGPVDGSLIDVVRDNRADFIKLTPSHLSVLRQLDVEGSRLRCMVVGGEDFRTHLALSISARLGPQLEIYNEYGPTEAVVGCMIHRYDPSTDIGRSVPIGRPADGVHLEVLNASGTPVPEGVPGELWIERPGLATGYHGLPDLTAERFQPSSSRSGMRRYRSGDLVRFRDPSCMEFLGRTDRQIKISGHRIEPGEIEAVLLAHPAIDECAVAPSSRGARATASEAIVYCRRCGLPSNYPRAQFDETELCNICIAFDETRERAEAYFRDMDDLRQLFEQSSATSPEADYDCLMLLSGGKDSSYALCQLVDMGLRVYAFTLDNGFISEGAKNNMRQVTERLGVPLEFAQTPAMNSIFKDSLQRFSNVCHGCFKTIYTLSTQRAHALGIKVIVTGLSRGQMFETRLTEELFRDGRFSPDEVDAAVLAARKVYHRVDDQVARTLDVSIFRNDAIFEEVQFVDFYRYCNAGLAEVLSYLDREVPWVRPADTGRSTNCLINDIGIYIHKKEQGYHNYALPYSWDVRLGHKTRDEALQELNDEIDLHHVRRTLLEVGYDEDSKAGHDVRELGAFYVSSRAVDPAELRTHLERELPQPMVPSVLRQVDAVPLTSNGKLDSDALPWPASSPSTSGSLPLEGPVEEYLAELWEGALELTNLGADAHFFEAGGTSLGAIEVMVRLCQEFDIELPLETLFEQPTLRGLAAAAEHRLLEDVGDLDGA